MIKFEDSIKSLPRHDFRDSIFDSVSEIMKIDERAVILTNDMGAIGLDNISKLFPQRVINVGITEQNIMGVAGGLALSNRTVFVYGIISHLIFRALEQIRIDICIQNLPVIIIGVGAGLSYGSDGPTHHGTEDIATMRALPNITIFNPSEGTTARGAVNESYKMKSPCFIRMDKEILPKLYENNDWSKTGFATHGESSTAFICGTGISTWAALEAKNCLKEQNIECTVVDFIKVKPIDINDLSSLFEKAKWVVVIEESVSSGGLWELIGAGLINKRIAFLLIINCSSACGLSIHL